MDPPARCINYLFPETILKSVTVRKVNNYVRKNCSEYYRMPPGFEFRGIAIQLKSTMLVGLIPESNIILMPFTKPCYGTMLYKIPAEDGDYIYIRSALGEKNVKTQRTGGFNRISGTSKK
jgi:hypothetical protein